MPAVCRNIIISVSQNKLSRWVTLTGFGIHYLKSRLLACDVQVSVRDAARAHHFLHANCVIQIILQLIHQNKKLELKKIKIYTV